MHCLFLFPGFSTSGLRHFICQVTGSEHIPGYKKKTHKHRYISMWLMKGER